MAEQQSSTSHDRNGDKAQPERNEIAVENDQQTAFDPESATLEQWQAQLAGKDDEIRQLQDKMLRLAAEMENTRKRLERERRDGIRYANECLLRDFLPVLDNLERALSHATGDAGAAALLEGVRMTCKSFTDVLEKFGCKPFESVGQPFDPNYHEAMLQQESDQQPENTVLQEFQKGYLLHDRLLRPALVIVSKAAAEATGQPAAGSAAEGGKA